MSDNYFLTLTTRDTLCTLQRIVFIFKRNRVCLEQMNIFETGQDGLSHLSIVLQGDDSVICKCMKQLQRVVEIIQVQINQ